MKPIPDNIKDILGQLQGPQQVALKAYIGTLRAEMKDLEAQLHALQNPAPDHGHYHGHELCTADHGHSEHAHDGPKHEHSEHKHEEHEHHKEHKEHEHKHNEHCDHKEHDHKEHDHKEHDHKEHDHKEHEHKEHHHGHEHKKHEHHGHDEVPAWKKKAMESDPTEAPFGGSWNTESNINAKHDKMQE